MDTPENLKTNYSEGVQLTSEIEIGQTGLSQLQTRLKNYSPDTVIDEEQMEGRYRISIPQKEKQIFFLRKLRNYSTKPTVLRLKILRSECRRWMMFSWR
jgi:hypothetical protein